MQIDSAHRRRRRPRHDLRGLHHTADRGEQAHQAHHDDVYSPHVNTAEASRLGIPPDAVDRSTEGSVADNELHHEESRDEDDGGEGDNKPRVERYG
jgi:hypothetical protein